MKQNLLDGLRRLRKTQKSTEKRGRYKKTPIIQAAEDGHVRLVQALLLQGAELTAQDQFGETALHYAAEKGHLDIVKVLVQAGASLFRLDNSRRTVLDCAKQRNHENVMEFLEGQLEHQKRTKTSPNRRGTSQPEQTVNFACIFTLLFVLIFGGTSSSLEY